MSRFFYLYRKLRWRLTNYDRLMWVFGLQAYLRPHLVTSRTALLIEGYPRSGNTFACTAFHLSQSPPVHVASHMHCPGHLKKAVRLGVPGLILIRQPQDAIASMLIFYQCKFPVRQAIREYIDFYETAWACRESLLIADFEEVRSDFGAVINRLNKRFGTNFSSFENTDENRSECFQQIDKAFSERYGEVRDEKSVYRITKPVEERTRLKEVVLAQLHSDCYKEDLLRAEEIYNRIRKGIGD